MANGIGPTLQSFIDFANAYNGDIIVNDIDRRQLNFMLFAKKVPEKNFQTRVAFFNSIAASDQGRILGGERLAEIARRLGITGKTCEKPLSSREIKSVVKDLTVSLRSALAETGVKNRTGFELVLDQQNRLKEKGAFDPDLDKEVCAALFGGSGMKPPAAFRDVKGMTKSLKAKLAHFPCLDAKGLGKFVEANFNRLQQLAYDRLYRQAYAGRAYAGRAHGFETVLFAGDQLLLSVAQDLMKAYGAGKDPDTLLMSPLDLAQSYRHLEPPANENLPENEALPEPFENLLSALNVSPQAPVTTVTGQMRSLVGFLKLAYRKARVNANGADNDQRKAAALGEFAMSDDVKNLLALGVKIGDVFSAKLQRVVLAKLSKEGVFATSPDTSEDGLKDMRTKIMTAVSEAVREILPFGQLQHAVINFADTKKVEMLGALNEATQRAFDERVNALLEGGDDKVISLLRVSLREGARLTLDDDQAPSQAVRNAITDVKRAIEDIRSEVVGQKALRQEAYDDDALKGCPTCAKLACNEQAKDCKHPLIAALAIAKCLFPEDKLIQNGILDEDSGNLSFGIEIKGQPMKFGAVLKEITRLTGEVAKDGVKPGQLEKDRARLAELERAIAAKQNALDVMIGSVPPEKFKLIVRLLKQGHILQDDHDPVVQMFEDRYISEKATFQALNVVTCAKAGSLDPFMLLWSILSVRDGEASSAPQAAKVVAAFYDEEGYASAKLKTNLESMLAEENPSVRHILFDGITDELQDLTRSPLKDRSMRELIEIFRSFGIGVEQLDTDEGLARMMLVDLALFVRGGTAEGLAEWTQRVTGMDFRTLKPEKFQEAARRLGKLLSGIEEVEDKSLGLSEVRPKEGAHVVDPLDAFARKDKRFAFLAGTAKFEESNLSKEDVRALMGGLRALHKGNVETVTLTLVGVDLTLKRSVESGAMVACVNYNKKSMQIRVPQSVEDLLNFLETQVMSDTRRFADLQVEFLPSLKDGNPVGMSAAHARELMVKLLSSRLNVPIALFAGLDLARLRGYAERAIKGTFTAAEAHAIPRSGYYSNEAKVQIEAFEHASPAERAKVKMPVQGKPLTTDDRKTRELKPAVVHGVVAELFLNADVTLFDSGVSEGAVDGSRIAALVRANQIEIERILDDLTLLNTLPQVVRDRVKTFFDVTLRPLVAALKANPNPDMRPFAAAESEVKRIADEVMGSLQEMANALFPDKPQDRDVDAWKRDFAQRTMGIDTGTAEGRVVSTVLKHYFAESDPIEKRAMMASLIRQTAVGADANRVAPTDGALVAAALKGAGPVLQKMLQGLPIESFGPETQEALRDMKCNLTHIPDAVVRAQLLDLIRNSDGDILSIQVLKPIGAATVAEAILCHITTRDAPVTGRDVVIKLQRPNGVLGAQRDKETIDRILARYEQNKQDLVSSFGAQYDGILREFDFTYEAENIDVARQNYNANEADRVHSMDRYRGVRPSVGTLVLEKIQGTTLQSSVGTSSDVLSKCEEMEVALAPNKGAPATKVLLAETPVKLAEARMKLQDVHWRLSAERKTLEKFISVWFEKGLLDTGFFHADLHAGNIMTTLDRVAGGYDCDLTFIDFGNVQRMSADEQKILLNMVIACNLDDESYGADEFLAKVKGLSLSEASKQALQAKRAALKDQLLEIFKKGGSDALLAKLAAATSALQSAGVELPESVGTFLTGVMRLRNSLASVDAGIEACERDLARIGCQAHIQPLLDDLIKPPDDEIDGLVAEPLKALLNDLKTVVETMSAPGANPSPLKKLSCVNGTAHSLGNVLWTIRNKAEVEKIEAFCRAWVVGEHSYLQTLAERLDATLCPKEGANNRSEGLLNELAEIQKAFANLPKAGEDDDRRKEELLTIGRLTSNVLGSLYSAICLAAKTHVDTTVSKEENRKSFEDILIDILENHSNDLRTKCDVLPTANFLELAHLEDTAEKALQEVSEDFRGDISPDARETLLDMVPKLKMPGGIRRTTALNTDELKDVLKVNLADIRKWLNRAENEHLTDGERNFLVALLKVQMPTLKSKLGKGSAVFMLGKIVLKNLGGKTDPYPKAELVSRPIAAGVKNLSNEDYANLLHDADVTGDEDIEYIIMALRAP